MPDIANFIFSTNFIQEINAAEKQEILKKHNKIIADLQILKGVRVLQVNALPQQKQFIQTHYKFLQHAMEINELHNSLLKAQNTLQRQLDALGPELSKRFWVNLLHIISDFRCVLAERFGSGEGDFSKHTLPHAPLLHLNDILLFATTLIGILSLSIPAAGFTIALIVTAALLLTSLAATLLSVLRATLKGDPDAQERTEINEQLADTTNQIEALFKNFNALVIPEESPIAANQQAPGLLRATSAPASLSSQSMFTNRTTRTTNEDFDSDLQLTF